MNEEKDRLGEFFRLVERGREDVYFAEKDRQALAQLKRAFSLGQRNQMMATKVIECPRCGMAIEVPNRVEKHDHGPAIAARSAELSLRYIWAADNSQTQADPVSAGEK